MMVVSRRIEVGRRGGLMRSRRKGREGTQQPRQLWLKPSPMEALTDVRLNLTRKL
jgi:hypothetical protein